MAEFISIPLGKIANLLHEEVSSVVGSKMERFQSLLIQLQQCADKCDYANREVNPLLVNIVDLACKIDDRLDTSVIEVESYRRVGNRMPSVLRTLENIAFRKVGSLIPEIEDATAKLSDLPVSRIKARWNAMHQNERRPIQLHSYDFKEHFIGRTKDIADIVSLITTEKSISNTTAIYGMLGSGKSSLAKRIYNHIDVRRRFEAFAWVSFSFRHFNGFDDVNDKLRISRDILKQLFSYHNMKDTLMPMEGEALTKELFQVLKEMKCLVVLDNILWGYDESEFYQALFVEVSESKSKILITTPLAILREIGPSYELQGLSEEEGWELLKKTALINEENGSQIDPQLKDIGMELVRMCKNLPLSISLVGGVLSLTNSISDWEMLKREMDIVLRESSAKDVVLKILGLSYDLLPIHLKACFLYLVYVSEDEDIVDVKTLHQMWIAEGMVSSNLLEGEKTLEDVAEECLAELATRSMIQVQVNNFSTARRFVSCRLHYPVREFCKERRELIVWACLASRWLHFIDISHPYWDLRLVCENSKLLRVLRVESCKIDGKLPSSIRNLTHLRFFSLKGCGIQELPSTIGKLQFLETLDLRVDTWEIVVPNVLWKLKRLRHLYLPACNLVPKGEDKLRLYGISKLETLVNFDSDKYELTDSEWKSLRHIEATVHGNKGISALINLINTQGHKLKETYLQASFSGSSFEESSVPLDDVFNCSKLHHLPVIWGRCELNEFKIPSSFSSNLIEFCLTRCQITEDPMQTLGKLPQLRKLALGKRTFMGKQMICEANSFPELRSLKITNLMHLEELVMHENTMPKLSCLEIDCCYKLKMIPNGLRFITTLTELKLAMHKEFNDRVRTVGGEGVDFEKVRHVPFISLEDW